MQAQSSNAKAIVVINAGLDTSNALKQASEFRITRGGQILTSPGMTINSVTAMGLDAGRFTTGALNARVVDAWKSATSDTTSPIAAGGTNMYFTPARYSAMTHYLKAVKEAGTDAGPADGQDEGHTDQRLPDEERDHPRGRSGDAAQLCGHREEPGESKGKFDYYKVGATIPPEQAYRPLGGGCPFVKAGK